MGEQDGLFFPSLLLLRRAVVELRYRSRSNTHPLSPSSSTAMRHSRKGIHAADVTSFLFQIAIVVTSRRSLIHTRYVVWDQ